MHVAGLDRCGRLQGTRCVARGVLAPLGEGLEPGREPVPGDLEVEEGAAALIGDGIGAGRFERAGAEEHCGGFRGQLQVTTLPVGGLQGPLVDGGSVEIGPGVPALRQGVFTVEFQRQVRIRRDGVETTRVPRDRLRRGQGSRAPPVLVALAAWGEVKARERDVRGAALKGHDLGLGDGDRLGLATLQVELVFTVCRDNSSSCRLYGRSAGRRPTSPTAPSRCKG